MDTEPLAFASTAPMKVGHLATSPPLQLHRMPLAWAAVAVPAAFLFWLFFMTPPL